MNEITIPQLGTKELNAYLDSEKVTNDLLVWAQFFNGAFKNDYFTIVDVTKRTKLKDEEEVTSLLSLLLLKGFAHRVNNGKRDKYKICLNPADKLKLLREHLLLIEKQKSNVVLEISKLEAQIAKSSKK